MFRRQMCWRNLFSSKKRLWFLIIVYTVFMVFLLRTLERPVSVAVSGKIAYHAADSRYSHIHLKVNFTELTEKLRKKSTPSIEIQDNANKVKNATRDERKKGLNASQQVDKKQLSKPVRVAATVTQANNVNMTVTTPHSLDCQSWCRKGAKPRPPFFITAVLLVRIYVKDLAKLTTRELRQWLYYLQYAGFEHVYVYDAFVLKNESQENALKSFIDEGYVTYVDWSHRAFPYSIAGTQNAAYQDCINKYGSQTKWQAAIDIDEYPFSPSDLQPNFVQRAVSRFSSQQASASEITMQNFLFLGKPLDDNSHPLLIDRIWRRTHGPANALVKPIYIPSDVSSAIVHHNFLFEGQSMDFAVNDLRLNHYWGARLQNWGENTPKILKMTRPDRSMKHIVRILQHCASECLPNTNVIYKKQWN